LKKVFIFPPNSLILYDLVKRFGYEPLAMMTEIGKKVKNPEIDSPPCNITSEEPRKGLRYCAIEVPSGVRGRLALIGPLVEDADAAIIAEETDISFGCSGCARANEVIKQLVFEKGIPKLVVKYPEDEKEAEVFIKEIMNFLKSIDRGKGK